MKALPDIPSGPESWKRFSAGVLEALRARTPLRSSTCEIDENVDGFMPLPRLPSNQIISPIFATTWSVTVGPQSYEVLLLPTPGVADHTPIAIDHGSGHDSHLIFSQQYVENEIVTIRVYNPSIYSSYGVNGKISVRLIRN